MKKLLALISFSCEKAGEMIEKRKLFGLSTSEEMRLTIHTSMCKACRSFEKQSDIMDKSIQDYAIDNKKSELSSDIKNQIINKLKDK